MVKNKSGFTLIELLVVMSVIAVLSSIVIVNISKARARARDAVRLVDARSMTNAINLVVSQSESLPYPTSLVSGLLEVCTVDQDVVTCSQGNICNSQTIYGYPVTQDWIPASGLEAFFKSNDPHRPNDPAILRDVNTENCLGDSADDWNYSYAYRVNGALTGRHNEAHFYYSLENQNDDGPGTYFGYGSACPGSARTRGYCYEIDFNL